MGGGGAERGGGVRGAVKATLVAMVHSVSRINGVPVRKNSKSVGVLLVGRRMRVLFLSIETNSRKTIQELYQFLLCAKHGYLQIITDINK